MFPNICNISPECPRLFWYKKTNLPILVAKFDHLFSRTTGEGLQLWFWSQVRKFWWHVRVGILQNLLCLRQKNPPAGQILPPVPPPPLGREMTCWSWPLCCHCRSANQFLVVGSGAGMWRQLVVDTDRIETSRLEPDPPPHWEGNDLLSWSFVLPQPNSNVKLDV